MTQQQGDGKITNRAVFKIYDKVTRAREEMRTYTPRKSTHGPSRLCRSSLSGGG
jgi:hypothetical protein